MRGLARRSRQRVAAAVLAGALASPVAAYVAGLRTVAVAALSAVVGLATAVWARSGGRRPLRRLSRWATRVGAEAMRNLPIPERPR